MLPVLLAVVEKSKVAFYFAGGALAVWAVVLSAIGLTRPEFPASVREQRGVVALTLVLMVIAMTVAIVTSNPLA